MEVGKLPWFLCGRAKVWKPSQHCRREKNRVEGFVFLGVKLHFKINNEESEVLVQGETERSLEQNSPDTDLAVLEIW